MKKSALLILVASSTLWAPAQETPESFLGQIPAMPVKACQVKPGERRAFWEKVAAVRKKLDREIARRKQLRTAWEREKKKTGKISKQEADAMADKMLRERFNTDLAEVRSMKNTSEEGRRAWAETLSSETAATGGANSEAAKAEQEKHAQMLEQTNALVFATKKLAAEADKYRTQLADLEKEFEAERERNDKVEREEADQRDKSGAAVDEGPPPPNHHYCEKYTPRFREILTQYRAFVMRVIPEYVQVEKQQNTVGQAVVEQANAARPADATNLPKAEPSPGPVGDGGLPALELIRNYVLQLAEIYRYDIDLSSRDSTSTSDGIGM